MKLLPLTKGYFTKLDDDDFKRFGVFRWSTSLIKGKPRATRAIYRNGKRIKTVYLYREIMGAKSGQYVDHINRDTLDNRKCNLRLCTPQENNGNSIGSQKRFEKGLLKGVYYIPKCKNKWRATIGINNRTIHLGQYATVEEAAKAYDKKAMEVFGEFARPNFPQTQGNLTKK